MRKTKIKTIDINALEWFDKINGNSYFAGTITINFGMKSVRKYIMPYQYGYGDHYIDMAKKTLEDVGETVGYKDFTSFRLICRHNNIILRTVKHENCKKAQLKNI